MAANVALCTTGLTTLTGRLIGNTAPIANYVGAGTGGAARTATTTDTDLTTLYGSRVLGTASVVTTTKTNDTFRLVGNITATSSVTINEVGSFNAVTSGNMFISSTIANIDVIAGDTIQFVFNTKFNN